MGMMINYRANPEVLELVSRFRHVLHHAIWHVWKLGLEKLASNGWVDIKDIVKLVYGIPNADRDSKLYNLLFLLIKSSVKSSAIFRRSSKSEF